MCAQFNQYDNVNKIPADLKRQKDDFIKYTHELLKNEFRVVALGSPKKPVGLDQIS